MHGIEVVWATNPSECRDKEKICPPMLVIEFPLVRPTGISLIKILAQRPAVKSCFTHVFM